MTQGPKALAPETKPPQLDDESAKLLTTHLKGITSVTLRIVGDEKMTGAAITGFLQGKGILVDVIHIEQIVPQPLRRFSFQYHGRSAVVTVTPAASLKG